MPDTETWDAFGEMNSLAAMFRSTVKASDPIGDDDMGYFVHVQGMDHAELAGWVTGRFNGDPDKLAEIAAAAIMALVLRDYEHEDAKP